MPAISFLLAQAGRRQRFAALEELPHRRIDALAPIDGEVGPGQAGLILEHRHRGLGQVGQHRPDPAGAEPMIAGHHRQPHARRLRTEFEVSIDACTGSDLASAGTV
jgi:hypothetical protein